MKPLILAAAALIAAPAMLSAQARPADKGVVLVELFTSEGCSSCPPADDLLRKLDGTRTADGRLIVGISEHVTYWNSLGWTDPFSAQTYTQRQSDYSDRFHIDSVYTPQMVVDGRTQFVGSDRAGLLRAVNTQTPGSIHLAIAGLQATPDTVKLHFDASNVPANQSYELTAVVVDDTDKSDVPRGENSGRTLIHSHVARTFQHVGSFKGPATQDLELQLPASVKAHPNAGHHVILFAQAPNLGAVVGSAEQAF